MKIGAHVSTAGGYSKAVERVADIGGTCLQIFSTSPRGWRVADPDDGELEKFTAARKERSISPVYFHASYLINLAGTKEVQEKSVVSLTAELNVAGRFNVAGSVIHLGSFKNGKERDGEVPLWESDLSAYDEMFENIKKILKETPKEALFIIENMGMRKVGKDLEEIAFIVEKVNDPRVRVCLDTCHLHVAGYDISTKEKLNTFLNRFDALIGLDLLEVVHINDSRDEFGALRDRHENIGEGYVKPDVFSLLFSHSKTRGLPFIAEVPGFDGEGPDRKNIDRLKGLAGV